MKLNYLVANAQTVPTQTETVLDGEAVTILRNRVIIELVADGHEGSTVKIEAPADDETFSDGDAVTATFAVKTGKDA